MADQLPTAFDPLRLAKAGAELSGRLQLAAMSRLAPSLLSTEGMVLVTLGLGVDDAGFHYLIGTLRTELQLRCERCLEKMSLAVERDVALAFVRNDAEAERLPSEYEPVYIESGQSVQLTELVEDELILSLPIVPTHGEGERCELAAEYQTGLEQDKQETAAKHPFAVLAELKGKKSFRGEK